ncbi:nucleotidyltransferase domain-containing protein [Nocardioides sp. TF02-7]|uniref:nucleotidyltransferase domain-containing protein n=1 Tax=Nocardioides sp. TF02-7 TaxID=2917724 RepID=UPI001F05723A|nr:nucleotidyltransferase domain-containing protein [Nocardioides sp. TF02-7]UMG91402.1 nucleotidyltransferase domain-containing protein [Nocardioides sp. TF02-7]
MDLSDPMRAVIPSAHGAVLAVLARTAEPLSGRKVAELVNGKVGQSRVNAVLGELADAGVVLRESRPPAKFYRLNREHVAAPGVLALANMWGLLVERIRDDFREWAHPPLAACLFGSAARGDAGPDSDIDVLVVRRATDDDKEPQDAWHGQVDALMSKVAAWSGNHCEVLELTLDELEAAAVRKDRLASDLYADAINLFGPDVRTLLRKAVRR